MERDREGRVVELLDYVAGFQILLAEWRRAEGEPVDGTLALRGDEGVVLDAAR